MGSALIGQSFDDPKYFWGRLLATGTFPYNAFNAENLTASQSQFGSPANSADSTAVRSVLPNSDVPVRSTVPPRSSRR